jgi:hypothetical protein
MHWLRALLQVLQLVAAQAQLAQELRLVLQLEAQRLVAQLQLRLRLVA